MVRKAAASGAAQASPDTPAGVLTQLERLQRDFEEFGLNGYQARVLVSLLRLGSAGAAQLAQVAGVHRTSAYPVLQELRARGLAQQLPGESAMWTTPGYEAILGRLREDHVERFHSIESRIDEARELLAQVVPEGPAQSTPYVQLLSSAAQARGAYDRLLNEAEREFLVLNRPPYSEAAQAKRSERVETEALGRDEVNPAVLDALARGVSIRVLYEAPAWEDSSATSFREAMGRYHAAGVDGRLADRLPIKLALTDRHTALVALTDAVLPDVGFPTNLLIEHPGFAEFHADAFDCQWEHSIPLSGPNRRKA